MYDQHRLTKLSIASAISLILGTSLRVEAQNGGSPPEATVAAIRATVEWQQLRIEKVEQSLDLSQRDIRLTRSEIDHDLEQGFWPIRLVGGVLVLLGIGSAITVAKGLQKAIDKAVAETEARVKNELNARIDRIDHSRIPIHVPRQRTEIEEQLRRAGFSHIHCYRTLDANCLTGGVVLLEFGVDPTLESSDVKTFMALIDEHEPDPSNVGFLIFTKGRVPPEVSERFPTLAFANNLATIGTNAQLVARLLVTNTKGV